MVFVPTHKCPNFLSLVMNFVFGRQRLRHFLTFTATHRGFQSVLDRLTTFALCGPWNIPSNPRKDKEQYYSSFALLLSQFSQSTMLNNSLILLLLYCCVPHTLFLSPETMQTVWPFLLSSKLYH